MRIDVILESNAAPETVAELGKLAEENGLGGVWVSNMNDARDPFINFVDLGRASHRIRLGPIAVSPYELHPLKMAAALLTLNEVSGGRAQIVVGAGGGTATAMGVPRERPVRAVRECVEILQAASSGKPVRYRGEIYKVDWYDPVWVRSPPPLIYVGANGPQMLRSAAKYADGIMVSDFVVAHVRSAREIIDRSLAESDRQPDTFRLNNFWAWHVKESREEAEREARIWLAVRGTLYPKYIEDVLDPDDAAVVNENISAFIKAYHAKSPDIQGVPDRIVSKLVAGATSASSVAELDREIERLRQFEAAGLTEIALRIYANPAASIRLIGERVIPALRGAAASLLMALVVSGMPVTELSAAEEPSAVIATDALGGETTVDVTGDQAFRSIAANATGMSHARFMFGKQLFETVWEPAPGSQPTTDGLGPVFNRNACSECHIGNGRGRPPESVDATMDSILIRLSIEGTNAHGGPKPVPAYGDQLQDRGIDGVPAEGRATITWQEIAGDYADGESYSLREPALQFDALAFGELPDDVRTSLRVASPMIGLGLLEAVPDDVLHTLADAEDRDGDGISGRVNMVWDAVNRTQAVGRFGWKANVPSLRQQSAGAALGDMGITTPVFPDDLCEPAQADCVAAARAVADPPELLGSFFDPLVRYTQLIAVPRQRGVIEPAVQRGAALFRVAGCASCHIPTLRTGDSEVVEVANQTIHPYTDLLLHDMDAGLADGRPDFLASGSEWRTPPLWGIGLTEVVGGFARYLHDGRARSLAEAILWHDGEGRAAKTAFREMPAPERADLMAFLESL